VEKYDENKFLLKDYHYDGISWVDMPRDKNSRLCNLVNSLINNNPQEDTTMAEENQATEVIKLKRTEYEELLKSKSKSENDKVILQAEKEKYIAELKKGKALYKSLKEEFEQSKNDNKNLTDEKTKLEKAYAEGEKLYNKGKEAYSKVKKQFDSLNEKLGPILKAEEEERVKLVNSMLKNVPDAQRESLRKVYDKNTFEELKVISAQLVNTQNQGPNGIVDDGKTNTPNDDVGFSAYEKEHGINLATIWADTEGPEGDE